MSSTSPGTPAPDPWPTGGTPRPPSPPPPPAVAYPPLPPDARASGGAADGHAGHAHAHEHQASPAASPPVPSGPPPVPPFAPGTLEPSIIAMLRTCFDPEIPLNIYDLKLIYAIDVDPQGVVEIRMTLTSPTCPVAGTLPGEVQQKVASVPGVAKAHVALVWEPPWEPSMLSEEARLQLGML
ncbi:MAG: iron-sulfur cluster assembly protein [Planctomycetia bacterium]